HARRAHRRGGARGRALARRALPARGPQALAEAPRVDVGREAGRMSTPATTRPEAAKARAIVLLSGGLDSTTALAWACVQGFACRPVGVDCGQRHPVGLGAAGRVAGAQGVQDHREVRVDLRAIGGSALTAEIAVPKSGVDTATIPVTYVPARNSVFLSLALGL